MDDVLDVQTTRRWRRPRAILVGLLIAIIGVGILVSLWPSPERHASDPETSGRPPGEQPIAAGTLDGIAWKQFAWSAPGGVTCLQFWAGASSTDCGHWNDDATPFAMVHGDAPITDGRRGASTIVIQGVVGPAISSVRVVQPSGTRAAATLTTCACADGNSEPSVFMLALTLPQTAVDVDVLQSDDTASGRFVVIAAFDGTAELGRVRVRVLSFGYCGRDTCT
jgi:hypothetical protein